MPDSVDSSQKFHCLRAMQSRRWLQLPHAQENTYLQVLKALLLMIEDWVCKNILSTPKATIFAHLNVFHCD